MHVKRNFISSYHLPLCFTISIDSEIVCTPVSVDRTTDDVPSFNWKDITGKDINHINNISCSAHQADSDHFYYDIVNTVHGCIRKCIPIKKRNEHAIVGWNNEVKHYHGIARSEFKFWNQNNMPRSSGVARGGRGGASAPGRRPEGGAKILTKNFFFFLY